MIVLSAELRREMTVLVIDGAEVAGEDGVPDDVEDEMRLRRNLGVAETLSVRNSALRTGRIPGLGRLVAAPCEAWHTEPPAEKGTERAGSFLVTSGLWGRPEISDAAPEFCWRVAAGTQPGARPQTTRALPTRRNDLPSPPHGSS